MGDVTPTYSQGPIRRGLQAEGGKEEAFLEWLGGSVLLTGEPNKSEETREMGDKAKLVREDREGGRREELIKT